MMRRLLFLLVLISFGTPWSRATDSKAGTSGAQFLKMGAGARPTAMGDAFVGVADDINAVYFNPAGLSNISRAQMTAMHNQWIDSLSYDFAAFAYPTDFGAFAVSGATLRVDDIQRRDTSEAAQGHFDAMDSAYGLTYSKNLKPLLSVGVTGRYIQQEIDSVKASGWSTDFGVQQRLVTMPLSLGLAIRHVGPSIKFRREADPLPTTLDAGASYTMFDENLRFAADVKKARDSNMKFGFGIEHSPVRTDTMKVSLRAGYNSSLTDASGSGITFGGGLGFRRFHIDFAWVPFGDFGNTYRYSLLFNF